MAFGNNFVASPDCVRRVNWFKPLDPQELPEGVEAYLLADAFDLTVKFGLVLPDGHSRCLEAQAGGMEITLIATMPREKSGPFLSVAYPPMDCGVSEVEDFEIQGCDGACGEVSWDTRVQVAHLWTLIREEDACMATYGCIHPVSGERFGVFDPAPAANVSFPVADFFRERGILLRLPDGVRPDAILNRFRPKGSVVMVRIDQVPHLCRAQDVEYIKEIARMRQRISDKVYRKYGFNLDSMDEGSAPDSLTQFRIQSEIDERLQSAMLRADRRRAKKGREAP